MRAKLQSWANTLLAECCTTDGMIHRVCTDWAEDVLGTSSIKDPSFHAKIITALKTAYLDSRKDVMQEGEADKDAEGFAVKAIVFAAFENQKRVAEQKMDDERTQDAEVSRSLTIVDAVVNETMATQIIALDVSSDVLQQIIAASEALDERPAPDTASSSRIWIDEQANENEAQVVLPSDEIPDEKANP